MSTYDDGGQAFPRLARSKHNTYDNCEDHTTIGGMSLRDYYAANAPLDVADANNHFYNTHVRNASLDEMLETLVNLRFAYADTMLARRLK